MARAPGLVDHLGNPIQRAVLKQEHSGPSLTGVRQILSDHPARGLTPGRLASMLVAAEQGDAISYLELAEDMEERDLHYAGVLATRKRQVAQLEITVEAASDDAADVANADLVREWLDRDTLADELFDVLDAVGKGYSATEIIWDTSEGQWRPARLEHRDPRWFEYDRESGRRLLLRDIAGTNELPAFKYIIHEAKPKSGLPIRAGFARLVAWSYLFKNYAIKDWVSFAEVFGMPIRVGKYPPSATAADREILLRAVASIGTDAAAIIPEGMVIEFVEAAQKGSLDLYERLCDWLDRQMSKAILGQTGTTEVQGGSYAAAKVHDHVREDIEQADGRQLAATLNRDLVRPMVDLNRGPQRRYPRIAIGRAESFDAKEGAEILSKLVGIGLKVGVSTVRDRFGWPDPDPDEEVLGAPEAAPAPVSGQPVPGQPPASGATPGSGPGARPEEVAEQVRRAGMGRLQVHARTGDDRDAIDDLVELGMDGWEAVADPAIQPILDAVEAATDPADLDRRLAAILADRETAPALVERLGRLLFTARLAGEAGLDNRDQLPLGSSPRAGSLTGG